jgi:UDP:flavonoid glycosyltransferase YjiC (YdhE family)
MLEHGTTWTTDLSTLNDTRRALGLAPLSGPAAWESCELVLVTAPRWLDLDARVPANVVHAGPLGMRAARRQVAVRPPRVLLSFSTTVIDRQLATMRNSCAAVAGIDAHAVLTLGPAVTSDDVDAPPNVEVHEWADHDEVLPACAAVVTHAGLGTTLRALAHGVPLLMLPRGRDQHVNSARVTDLGAGIALPAEAAPERIRAALTRLLGDPRFAACAARLAERMAADRPDSHAADALERAARCGRRLSVDAGSVPAGMSHEQSAARFTFVLIPGAGSNRASGGGRAPSCALSNTAQCFIVPDTSLDAFVTMPPTPTPPKEGHT